MLDDKKSDIYKIMPEQFLPATISTQSTNQHIERLIDDKGMIYPLIVKPDVGYKGFLVRKVDTKEELLEVLRNYNHRDIIIQEFLPQEREFALLFYRMPRSGRYGITSFTEKTLPFVIGDGTSTLGELIAENSSAFLDKLYVLKKKKDQLNNTIPKGKKVIIDHVGNYSRGSKFYSRNEFIDDKLVEVCRQFFTHLDGINFGRIDLKANSIEEVKAGNFKVMEINGAKAEPLHIYGPKMSFLRVWKDISEHWSILNQIVSEQLSRSFLLPSARDGIRAAKSLKRQVS